MFVRWKRRINYRWEDGSTEASLCAVVVESVRVDGKPRQKFVAHLACINEMYTDLAEERYKFWEKVDSWLRISRTIERIDENTQQAIEDKIAETVPPPTEEYVRRLVEK